jgi:hypothetical protein
VSEPNLNDYLRSTDTVNPLGRSLLDFYNVKRSRSTHKTQGLVIIKPTIFAIAPSSEGGCLSSAMLRAKIDLRQPIFLLCVCLLLQDLVQSCLHGGGGDMGGHVLRETTSRGLCGLGYQSRTSERGGGTREEPGTLTQGAPVFPGSSRLGIEPKTPGWLVQAQPPDHRGI